MLLKRRLDCFRTRKALKSSEFFNRIKIDRLLSPYFKNCYTESTYIESANSLEGTTRYIRKYDNSGLLLYQKRYGVLRAIITATIGTALGEVKSVGAILSFVFSAFTGYTPDYDRLAEAQTLYSYRYIEDYGQVFCYDLYSDSYSFESRAASISREKYQHELGSFTDTQGYIHTKTTDYPDPIQIQNAPHKGNATFLKQQAYDAWFYNGAAYYEDWND